MNCRYCGLVSCDAACILAQAISPHRRMRRWIDEQIAIEKREERSKQ